MDKTAVDIARATFALQVVAVGIATTIAGGKGAADGSARATSVTIAVKAGPYAWKVAQPPSYSWVSHSRATPAMGTRGTYFRHPLAPPSFS